MRNSRLIGGKPKIGIRPIIDGRRGGIRESLEDMTMAMAHKVAELYSSVLRHSDGTSVECVIADTTIGGVAEAAMAAEKFRNSGVGVVLSVTPCWCYGFETIDMDGEMPKAIWGFNGTERPGAVYLASALASHTQKGLPTFGIYGRDVQEVTNMEIPEDVQEKLLRFARAGIAVATMKGKSYLSIGSVSMGIAGSIPNPFDIQDKKGTIFKTDPTIEYFIEREDAKVVFLRYRKTTEELEQSVILTEVKNAYKDVAGLYETDSLINNRPAFEKEVEALLKERLSTRGFTFTNIQSSVKPNDVLQAAIDEKNTAVQNALKVENEKKAAIAEAEKVVAAAKGKADANRILQQSITPELIQLKAVEKWDGKLPLSTGGNTLPFLKLQ